MVRLEYVKGFDSSANLSIMPFHWIVIVFPSIFLARNRNAKFKFRNPIEQFLPHNFIDGKFIRDECYQVPFPKRFRSLFSIAFQYLGIAPNLYDS